jgi:hypothetical protein
MAVTMAVVIVAVVFLMAAGQEEDNAFFIIINFKVPLIKFGGLFFALLNNISA